MFRLLPQQRTSSTRSLMVRDGRVALTKRGEPGRVTAEVAEEGSHLVVTQKDPETLVVVNGLPVSREILPEGAVLQVDDQTWTVHRVFPPLSTTQRRSSPLRRLTFLLLLVVGVGQFFFLYWISARWSGVPPLPPPRTSASARPAAPKPKPKPAPPGPTATGETPAPGNPAPSTPPKPPKPPIPSTPATPEPPTPAPTPPLPAPPAPTPPLPSPDARAEELLAAKRAFERGDYFQAERILDGLLRADPAFLPAYVEKARALEQQGRFAQAVAQWRQVLSRRPDAALETRARAEEARLARMQAMLDESTRLARERSSQPALPPLVAHPYPPPAPAQPTVPAPSPPAQTLPPPPVVNAPPSFRVDSGVVKRMPASAEYEDMRLFNMVFTHAFASRAAKASDLGVRLFVYERDLRTRELIISPISATLLTGQSVPAEIQPGQTVELQFSYVVPIGTRSEQARKTGKTLTYHGFVFELYHKNRLEARYAHPESLLKP